MKKYPIELSAVQVIALFEMCEFASTAIHKQASLSGDLSIPESFALVMSIQSKLDGCEHLLEEDSFDPATCEPLKSSLLDLSQAELNIDGSWKLKELRVVSEYIRNL